MYRRAAWVPRATVQFHAAIRLTVKPLQGSLTVKGKRLEIGADNQLHFPSKELIDPAYEAKKRAAAISKAARKAAHTQQN